jgi:hypothetical protein
MPAAHYRVEAIVFMTHDLSTGKAATNYQVLLTSGVTGACVRAAPKKAWIVTPQDEIPEDEWVYDLDNHEDAIEAALEEIAEEIRRFEPDSGLSSDESDEEPGAHDNGHGEGHDEGTTTTGKGTKRARAASAGDVSWEMYLGAEAHQQSPSRESERRVNLQSRESPDSASPQGQPKRWREGVRRHRAVEGDQQPDHRVAEATGTADTPA